MCIKKFIEILVTLLIMKKLKMEKIEISALIKIRTKLEVSAQTIIDELVWANFNQSPKYRTVAKRVAQFNDGKESKRVLKMIPAQIAFKPLIQLRISSECVSLLKKTLMQNII